ncbi:MAG: tetratricopeptide repeat protein [Hymenobacter sp.]|nr:MAG: tetratricopeptide repeat protein [Hymenobacter sp.]
MKSPVSSFATASFAAAALALLTVASGCATSTDVKRPLSTTVGAAALDEEDGVLDPLALPLPKPAAGPVAAVPVETLDAPSAEAAGASLDPAALSTQEASDLRFAERRLVASDFRARLDHANELLKTKPRDGRALFERAKAHSNLKNYKQAKPDYIAALRTLRGNPDVHYNKGINELMLKNFKLAANDFSGTVRLRPDDKEAFFGRGVAKMQMYQYKAAVADFTRALAIDSMYAEALEYRGISYSNYDRTKEAEKDFLKAVKLDPSAKKRLRRYSSNLAQK